MRVTAFGACALVGVLLLAAGGLLIVADADGLSARMPTQLPPRRFARYPLMVGAALLVVGLAGLLVS